MKPRNRKLIVALGIIVALFIVSDTTLGEMLWAMTLGVAIGLGEALVLPPAKDWYKYRVGCPNCRGDYGAKNPAISWRCGDCGKIYSEEPRP